MGKETTFEYFRKKCSIVRIVLEVFIYFLTVNLKSNITYKEIRHRRHGAWLVLPGNNNKQLMALVSLLTRKDSHNYIYHIVCH